MPAGSSLKLFVPGPCRDNSKVVRVLSSSVPLIAHVVETAPTIAQSPTPNMTPHPGPHQTHTTTYTRPSCTTLRDSAIGVDGPRSHVRRHSRPPLQDTHPTQHSTPCARRHADHTPHRSCLIIVFFEASDTGLSPAVPSLSLLSPTRPGISSIWLSYTLAGAAKCGSGTPLKKGTGPSIWERLSAMDSMACDRNNSLGRTCI